MVVLTLQIASLKLTLVAKLRLRNFRKKDKMLLFYFSCRSWKKFIVNIYCVGLLIKKMKI